MAYEIEHEADIVRNKAKKDLLNLLEGVRGKKNLVVSRELLGPLGLFVAFSTLKEYGVEKVFDLENGNTDTSERNIVYLVLGEKAPTVQAVADQIRKLQKSSATEHEISIFWVPRKTLVSNKILEEEAVLGDVNVSELPLFFLPLENDLFSLELNGCLGDLYLRNDPGPIFIATKALMQLQHRYGLFPRILGKGEKARTLADLLLRQRKELDADEAAAPYGNMPSTVMEQLIIIDRDVDFASVLLTQLTYEGLIEELIGIKHNQAEVDTSIVSGAAQLPGSAPASTSSGPGTTSRQTLKRKVLLDSSDALYSLLRSSNFATIGPQLNKTARRLEAEYSTKDKARGIAELREFVNKLPGYQQEHQSLATHTNLADELSKQTRTETFNNNLEIQQNTVAGTDPSYQHPLIEDLIARSIPLPTILRLLCLESTVVGGFRPRELESFKRLILHAYGYQHLLTLDRLEKMGLLVSRPLAGGLLLPVGGASSQPASGLKTNYAFLRRELKLIVDEYNETDPEDVAYVFSGYAPLSVRIVQCVVQKQYLQSLHRSPLPLTPSSTGWQGFEDILKSAKGPTFSMTQKAGEEKSGRAKAVLTSTSAVKTVVVMFLGGITSAEVSAIRFVNKKLEQEGKRRKLLICTTGMVSGRSIMDEIVEKKSLAKVDEKRPIPNT